MPAPDPWENRATRRSTVDPVRQAQEEATMITGAASFLVICLVLWWASGGHWPDER